MDSSNLVIFTISSFALGAILLMTKNSVHPKFKRGLATAAVFMIAVAFIMVIYTLFTL